MCGLFIPTSIIQINGTPKGSFVGGKVDPDARKAKAIIFVSLNAQLIFL